MTKASSKGMQAPRAAAEKSAIRLESLRLALAILAGNNQSYGVDDVMQYATVMANYMMTP